VVLSVDSVDRRGACSPAEILEPGFAIAARTTPYKLRIVVTHKCDLRYADSPFAFRSKSFRLSSDLPYFPDA
jgi:hypothetical protein